MFPDAHADTTSVEVGELEEVAAEVSVPYWAPVESNKKLNQVRVSICGLMNSIIELRARLSQTETQKILPSLRLEDKAQQISRCWACLQEAEPERWRTSNERKKYHR
jgi:hypothetical protein